MGYQAHVKQVNSIDQFFYLIVENYEEETKGEIKNYSLSIKLLSSGCVVIIGNLTTKGICSQ